MEMTYGVHVTNTEDRFLQAARDMLKFIDRAVVPGTFLVNVMPIRALHEVFKPP